jgi:hypothetical protein
VDRNGVAGGDGPSYDDGMEARVARIESDLVVMKADIAVMKTDIAVIKATAATKTDLAQVRAEIAEAKSSIIMWVVSAIFIAQLLPALLKLLEK